MIQLYLGYGSQWLIQAYPSHGQIKACTGQGVTSEQEKFLWQHSLRDHNLTILLLSLVWYNKGILRLDEFRSHQRLFLQMRNSQEGYGCSKRVFVPPVPHPSKGGGREVAEESHQSTLLPAESHFWGKGKPVVALTNMIREGLLSENTVEKVHLCKH